MKTTYIKIVAAFLMLTSLSTSAYAENEIAPTVESAHSEEASHDSHDSHASKFYVIAKALTISGDTVGHTDHGHTISEEGDRGYGLGIDLGYRLGKGFSLEYNFSYAENTVTETEDDGHGHIHTVVGDGEYTTHALSAVYTYHITHSFGVFGKIGYIYEKERIDELHVNKSDKDAAYAAGLEYALNNHYSILVEYEHANIKGPRGDSIFTGIMYNF